jgi:predicted metalloprotease
MGIIGVLVIVVLSLVFNVDPQALMNQAQQAGPAPAGNAASTDDLSPEEQAQGVFASQVLALTEDVWSELLAQRGLRYQPPNMVLFSRQVRSACGVASSASGPFYCPADSKLYIDTSFFDELSERFGAPGDFARAYVIAHEVGHHIQNLMGTTDKLDAMRGRVSEREMNAMSVRLELQADFYAGVFAHHLQGRDRILERGDIDEAIRCAAQIGDDRLQSSAGGAVVPDSFTHGTSEQRARWFLKGFETGDISQGDTFQAERL